MLSYEDIKKQTDINSFCEQHFNKAKDNKAYICPLCNSGANHDSALRLYKNTQTFFCFSCETTGDIFDLAGAYLNTDNKKEQRDYILNWAGIIDDDTSTKPINKKPLKKESEPTSDIERIDYSSYLLKAKETNDYKYLESRGISKDNQDIHLIGYDPNWTHPNAKGKSYPSPRVIIPRGKYNYLARAIDTNNTMPKGQVGKGKTLFNQDILLSKDRELNEPIAIFIVEGEIDAMSINEIGLLSIGLCSLANRKYAVEKIKEANSNLTYIIMLDNDEPGIKATEELRAELNKAGITNIIADYKEHDPNDYLVKDRESFTETVKKLEKQAIEAKKQELIKNKDSYETLKTIDYFKHIEEQPPQPEFITGFSFFDDDDSNLAGGLHDGLYILGALSSLGKTTFCFQLASQISDNGTDVLFFSLEQSRKELIAKSISRWTYLLEGNNTENGNSLAKSISRILNSRYYVHYSDKERQVINEAIVKTEQEARNLTIYEGKYNGQRISPEIIDRLVKQHIEQTGRTPVVFIDYLQILSTEEDFRGTDKQAIDLAVEKLKDISRENQTLIFAISSFNRDNYDNPVNMTSFKESGAIEYSSDVLLGLQLSGMDRLPDETDTQYKKRIRGIKEEKQDLKNHNKLIQIDLKFLKNRNGKQKPAQLYYSYTHNTYKEKL